MPFGGESCEDKAWFTQNPGESCASPMPFGGESCEDSGSFLNTLKKRTGHQCLSAGSPVRTTENMKANQANQGHQCLSAGSPVRTCSRYLTAAEKAEVTNAFRRGVL